MPSRAEARVTPEEYLALERASPYKSEYFDGEVFAMTGASRRHNLISLNIGAELRAQLRDRPCEVYTCNMRVKVSSSGGDSGARCVGPCAGCGVHVAGGSIRIISARKATRNEVRTDERGI